MKNTLSSTLFILVAALLLNIQAFAQTGPPPEKGDPPTERELSVLHSRYEGLQIGREQLFKGLKSYDSTLNFSIKKNNNVPVAIAHGTNNSIVEVIGADNNLRKVTYTTTMTPGNKKKLSLVFILLVTLSQQSSQRRNCKRGF